MEREMAKKVREAVNEALQGIKIPGVYFSTVGRISYGSGKATARIQANAVSGDASTSLSTDEVETLEFAKHAPSFGLKPTDFGRTFVVSGSSYRLCGIKPKSYKYPFLGKSQRGARYKFTAAQVKGALGIPPDAWDTMSAADRRECDLEAKWEARVS